MPNRLLATAILATAALWARAQVTPAVTLTELTPPPTRAGLEVVTAVGDAPGEVYVAGHEQGADAVFAGYVARVDAAGEATWRYRLLPRDPTGGIRCVGVEALARDSLRVVYTEAVTGSTEGAVYEAVVAYRGGVAREVDRHRLSLGGDGYHQASAASPAPPDAPDGVRYYLTGSTLGKADGLRVGYVAAVGPGGEVRWRITDADLPEGTRLATDAVHAAGPYVYFGVRPGAIGRVDVRAAAPAPALLPFEVPGAPGHFTEWGFAFGSRGGVTYAGVTQLYLAHLLRVDSSGAVVPLGGDASGALVTGARAVDVEVVTDTVHFAVAGGDGLLQLAILREGGLVGRAFTDLDAAGIVPPLNGAAGAAGERGGAVTFGTRDRDGSGLLVRVPPGGGAPRRVFRFGESRTATLPQARALLPRRGGGACVLYEYDGRHRVARAGTDGAIEGDAPLDTSLGRIVGRVYGWVGTAAGGLVVLTELNSGGAPYIGLLAFDETGAAAAVASVEHLRDDLDLTYHNRTLFVDPRGGLGLYTGHYVSPGAYVENTVYYYTEELAPRASYPVPGCELWFIEEMVPLGGGELLAAGTTRADPQSYALSRIGPDGRVAWCLSLPGSVETPKATVRALPDGSFEALVENSPEYRPDLRTPRRYHVSADGRLLSTVAFELGEVYWYRSTVDFSLEGQGFVAVEAEAYETAGGLPTTRPIVYEIGGAPGQTGTVYAPAVTLPLDGARVEEYREHRGRTYVLSYGAEDIRYLPSWRRVGGIAADAVAAPASVDARAPRRLYLMAFAGALTPAPDARAAPRSLGLAPNPVRAGGAVRISGIADARHGAITSATLTDVSGRHTLAVALDGDRLRVPWLAPGTYVLEIETADGQATASLLVR